MPRIARQHIHTQTFLPSPRSSELFGTSRPFFSQTKGRPPPLTLASPTVLARARALAPTRSADPWSCWCTGAGWTGRPCRWVRGAGWFGWSCGRQRLILVESNCCLLWHTETFEFICCIQARGVRGVRRQDVVVQWGHVMHCAEHVVFSCVL